MMTEIHTCDTYSARPYNSALSLWLSVDPLSDKYPNLSPYVYCANNPVRLVDEDGRDIYEFTSEGKITNIGKCNVDIFYKVDENGNKIEGTTLNLNKKAVTGQITLKSNAGTTVNYLKVKGDNEASLIFEHLAKNSTESNTEYGLARIGKRSGRDGKNMIGTDAIHKEYGTSANLTIFQCGYTIRQCNHNHPDGNKAVSSGDIDVAKQIQKKFPQATFFNYTTEFGYTKYDHNSVPQESSIFTLPSIIITP